MADILDRRPAFRMPERPEWLSKINLEGKVLDSESIVPLDAASLIDAAQRRTGLTDFGDDEWKEPFAVLLDALQNDAKLHLLGRIYTRSDLLMYLQNRLQITQWYKRHPEIDNEIVDNPVFIIGLGRSGTTILHEVLSQDDSFRTARKWEALFPCPPPEESTYFSDPRIGHAHDLITLQDRIAPDWKAKHAVAGGLPVECVEFTPSCFASELFTASFQIPSYDEYLKTYNFEGYYNWHRRVVKLLQWRYKKRAWLFKGANHLPYITQLLSVYPVARIIFPVRDPIVSVASIVSVLGTIYSFRTDDPFSSDTYTRWMRVDTTAAMLEEVIALIDRGVLGPDNLSVIRYVDFCDDPMTALKKVYQDFSMDFPPAVQKRMSDYLKAKPRAVYGKHDYYLGDPKAIETERQMLRRFQDYFNVPSEV